MMKTFYTWLTYFLILTPFFINSKSYNALFKPHLEKPRSSIKGIDGTYVINLDVRPERWHRLEPILYYHNIECSRFSAVFGMDFDIRTIKTFCARHLGIGALGCMLSHLSIYQDALQRGLKIIWVLEDDVTILRDPKVLTPLIQELNSLDPEWDILYTDLDFINSEGKYTRNLALPQNKKHPFLHPLEYYTNRENVSENLQRIFSRFGTTSMIVSRRGMKKVLDYFTTYDDILYPIDIEMHFIPDLRQYGIINPVATNEWFSFNFSDASPKHNNNFYEISDANVKYIQSRLTLFENLRQNWQENFPIP